jgi:ribosomal protein S18 acetylase RimI-like enzyme
MLTIQRAQLNDAEEILALQKLAYESEATLYNDWSIPPLTQSLQSLLAEFGDHVILKGIKDQSIVGSVRAKFREGICTIGRLIVHPTLQGQGIGSSLLRKIEESFPTASRYELFTGSRSERNIRLYQRKGYSITHTKSLSPNVDITFLHKLANLPR